MLRPFHTVPEIFIWGIGSKGDRSQSKAGLEDVSWGSEGREGQIHILTII